MSVDVPTSRQKILIAAAELAHEVGPANLSLEAIAARAGLSKGGLLYNFPSKSKLLEAVVQHHVDEFETALEAIRAKMGGENVTAKAFLTLFFDKLEKGEPPPAGILAALAEGLNFLQPVRSHTRALLDRMIAEGLSPADTLLLYATVEGLRSMRLFETDVMTREEKKRVRDRLFALVEPGNRARA